MHVTNKEDRGKFRNINVGLFTFITLLVFAAPSQGVTSTCDVPTVPEGQQTTLTCHFSEDLSQLNRKFKVVHYFAETNKSEIVLLCYWFSGVAQCQAHRDYKVVVNVTDKLMLNINRASKSHTGRYLCHAFQSAAESDESCNFSLKRVKSSCNIPEVVEGENATLSCHFGDDISRLQMRVKVVHYTNDKTENVLLCAWADGKAACQAKDGYTFGGKVTDTLLLEIPFVSPDHAGGYRCQLYQSAKGTDDLCHFSVKDKSSSILELGDKDLMSPIYLILSTVVGTAILLIERHFYKKSKHHVEDIYQQSDIDISAQCRGDTSSDVKTFAKPCNGKTNHSKTSSESNEDSTHDSKVYFDEITIDLKDDKHLGIQGEAHEVEECCETSHIYIAEQDMSPAKDSMRDLSDFQKNKVLMSHHYDEVCAKQESKAIDDGPNIRVLKSEMANLTHRKVNGIKTDLSTGVKVY